MMKFKDPGMELAADAIQGGGTVEKTKTMRLIGLVATLMIAGCASTPPAPDVSPVVVMDYRARSEAESAAWRSVMEADAETRKALEGAYERAREAYSEYAVAASLLKAEELPEGAVRPTEEQVEALRAAAEAAWLKYWLPLNEQMDRYDGFLKTYPENWYVRHRFAWFLADMQFEKYAAEEWERVIEQEPRFPYAYNNLATLYNHMGRDKESITLFHKAIELQNDDPVFWTNLAVNYSTHRAEAMELYGWDLPRTFRECLNAYRRARELDPHNVEIARDLATQFVLAKYFNVTDTADEALEAWDYYLGLDLSKDQRVFGYLNIGRIYLRQKDDPETAIRWLEKALALDEGNDAANAVIKSARAALAERDAASKGTEAE